MMKTKHDLMAVMLFHSGRENAVSSRTLANEVGVSDRQLRTLITECRQDGFAICGHPSSGYFVASNQAELEETLEFLRHRALTSLKLASVLGNIPLGDLIGQLHINT
jgi:biotin operon repressor